jgi:exopolysaccharide biosynthesis WecB/TagA/CpsF family protein
MHIAIDASRATRAQRTGTENYARQLIERLVRTHPEVRWTLFFRDDPQDWLADLPHVARRVLPAARLWTYTALAPALLRLRPDLFWEPAHVLPPTAPLIGIPSLVTVHDLGYEHFPAAHTWAQRTYLQLTTRYHVLAATKIIADSEATRTDLIRLYGTSPSKISVVPLGIDHEQFRPITNTAMLSTVKTRYKTGERFILYVGTLQPRKNLHRLIRAFAQIAPRFPDINLVLAGGQGWLAEDLQALVNQLGVGERVVKTGYIEDSDLPALLSAAELFAFPSLFEGFGLPVLEAMACGTPVVTSNTSSLPEVAGTAALQVNPIQESQIADALALVLSQPALQEELRQRGLRHAAQFTWEQSAAQIWAEIETLLLTNSLPNGGKRALLPAQEISGRISILGLPVDNLSWDEVIARIAAMVEAGGVHQVTTANPEFLMRARREPAFMEVLRRAELVLADGVGFLHAAQWKGTPFSNQITGSDLTPRLAALAADKGWYLYLLGAAPGVAEQAAAELRKRYPLLNVTADGSDPTPDGPPELVARIRMARPHILLVAYGAPKQDYWIDQFGRTTGVPVQIGIGGSLDFIAGVVPRAPEAWRNLGVEWLWRLKQEPWRWRRMLALPHFALLAAIDAVTTANRSD